MVPSRHSSQQCAIHITCIATSKFTSSIWTLITSASHFFHEKNIPTYKAVDITIAYVLYTSPYCVTFAARSKPIILLSKMRVFLVCLMCSALVAKLTSGFLLVNQQTSLCAGVNNTAGSAAVQAFPCGIQGVFFDWQWNTTAGDNNLILNTTGNSGLQRCLSVVPVEPVIGPQIPVTVDTCVYLQENQQWFQVAGDLAAYRVGSGVCLYGGVQATGRLYVDLCPGNNDLGFLWRL